MHSLSSLLFTSSPFLKIDALSRFLTRVRSPSLAACKIAHCCIRELDNELPARAPHFPPSSLGTRHQAKTLPFALLLLCCSAAMHQLLPFVHNLGRTAELPVSGFCSLLTLGSAYASLELINKLTSPLATLKSPFYFLTFFIR